MHYFMFAALCVIWGSSFIMMKKAALAFGPLSIGGLRCASGAILLLGVWALWRRSRLTGLGALAWVAVTVVLGYSYPYSVQPFLVARYGSGFIGMMVSFVPLLTVLVSIPLLKIYPSRWQLLGVVGGLACVALVMLDGFERSISVAHMLLALSVPASYALANTLIKKTLNEQEPLLLALLCMGLTGLLLSPVGLLVEPVTMGQSFDLALLSLLALGILGTGVATYFFMTLIQARGPLFAGLVTYVVPFGALAWGWFDSEQVSRLQILALVGVLAMVAVVQVDMARRAKGRDAKAS